MFCCSSAVSGTRQDSEIRGHAIRDQRHGGPAGVGSPGRASGLGRPGGAGRRGLHPGGAAASPSEASPQKTGASPRGGQAAR